MVGPDAATVASVCNVAFLFGVEENLPGAPPEWISGSNTEYIQSMPRHCIQATSIAMEATRRNGAHLWGLH